jgi:hypothetical protein
MAAWPGQSKETMAMTAVADALRQGSEDFQRRRTARMIWPTLPPSPSPENAVTSVRNKSILANQKTRWYFYKKYLIVCYVTGAIE